MSSATQTQVAGPHDGKRLSPWRVSLGVLVVLATVAGGFFGYRVFATESVREEVAAPWFAGYVDVTATPTYAFETPVDEVTRDVVLSFVVAQSPEACIPTWGAAYDLDAASRDLDLDRRIARLRQQGGAVIVSFGGAANTELATACADAESLASAYTQVIDRYDISTIDLDIESDDLADPSAGLRRALAIASVQEARRAAGDDLGVWLTLPVSPSGLTEEGEGLVAGMLRAGVDVAGLNAMTMDYGIELEGSMGQAAVDALQALHGQLTTLYDDADIELSDASVWAKIAATPMIGQNDVVDEVFTLDDARTVNGFAAEHRLGRVSMWSLNRDRTCGANYGDVRVVSDACSGVDQGDDTFAELLAPGFGGHPDAAATTTPTPRPSSSDDASTSPYPIWREGDTYLAGTKVVWHGNVYEAKWWTRGDLPDDPVLSASEAAWTIIGPVLNGEAPYVPPTLPAGTFPDWAGDAVYEAGARVLFDGVPFEAKWWTRGDSPAAVSSDPDGSPWVRLTTREIEALVASATPA